jgi:predicted peptidase
MKVIAFSSILFAAVSFQWLSSSAYSERVVSTAQWSFRDVAQVDNADTFEARIFKNRHGKTMPYRLFIPRNYDPRKKYPLLLWLHGGGGRGTDNVKQISGGNTSGSHIWTTPANQATYPSFVLAPQCPEDAMWTSIDRAESTDQLKLALELLAAIQKEFSIDVHRIYVAGQSMGGLGAWSLISEHPGMFAAAIPVCGGGDETLAPKLVKTAIWAFHGAQDQAISADRSRRMIAAIRKAGGSPRYTEYPDLGHNSWDRAFAEPDLVPWMFAQRTMQR